MSWWEWTLYIIGAWLAIGFIEGLIIVSRLWYQDPELRLSEAVESMAMSFILGPLLPPLLVFIHFGEAIKHFFISKYLHFQLKRRMSKEERDFY